LARPALPLPRGHLERVRYVQRGGGGAEPAHARVHRVLRERGGGEQSRDSNLWRAQQGISPVRIGGEEAGLGTRYFENVEIDEV
jgi:hypothetical protein